MAERFWIVVRNGSERGREITKGKKIYDEREVGNFVGDGGRGHLKTV
jgi:hypothetical protein